jgi:hypothetical protein
MSGGGALLPTGYRVETSCDFCGFTVVMAMAGVVPMGWECDGEKQKCEECQRREEAEKVGKIRVWIRPDGFWSGRLPEKEEEGMN